MLHFINLLEQLTSPIAGIITFILCAIGMSIYFIKTKDHIYNVLNTPDLVLIITGVSGVISIAWPVILVIGIPLFLVWTVVYMIYEFVKVMLELKARNK